MNFEDIEDQDGIRLSWNTFSATPAENARAVIPIAAMYTPLHENERMTIEQYDPVACRAPCRAVLNPYCHVDLRARFWICPFCFQRNPLPAQYSDISSNSLPLELLSQSTTMEYVLSKPVKSPPVFLFVMDTAVDESELTALKDAVIVSLSLLPPDAIVGLITYGSLIQVHEIGFEAMPKSYVFQPAADYSTMKLQQLLALSGNQIRSSSSKAKISGTGITLNLGAASRFLMPVQKCEMHLLNILEQLQPDCLEVPAGQRQLRCTGAAVKIASDLLGIAFPKCGSRIELFCGGPCTVGLGQVVSTELKEPMRSHSEIANDKAKHFKKSKKFYSSLAERLSNQGHALDLFAGCLDQVGIMEMENLVNNTGGAIVLSDSFTTSIFKQSFQRLFSVDASGYLKMGFMANLEVLTSKGLTICGMIGNGVGENKKGTNISDTQIGISKTNSWKMAAISPKSSYALYFDLGKEMGNPNSQRPTQAFIQFLTYYQHSSGTYRLRVTTISRSFITGNAKSISESFDQEAAAAIVARMALFKCQTEDEMSVTRWIDRNLIRLCQHFADYRKEDPSSFRLLPNFTLYPQFIFHLRRSPFLHIFNNSPDETSFYRHMLNVADVNDSLIMIQPTLQSYSFNEPEGVPVLLDSVSIKPDVILLLDTYFHILIFHGSTIAQWRNAGYQEQPEYVNLKELLLAPRLEVTELLADRFPIPRFIVCDQGGSQARFLLSRINPSVSFNKSSQFSPMSKDSETVLTDDVNLQKFMDHLRKMAVIS
ncbi:COPII cargo receptor subunit Sec23b [Schizosaccharomyces pombe]|uniref:Protein transport protein sec23-2 n=1 Tax=Schizosaccharomyces pombe (strain 972 / ATCC 24843) TaxID=284812 RepID=SC232_SCHPO|nr:putative COPII cargo receptor subunit Sec23b [Schizosaccharomyces pombe]O94672.1 RecName: Full=Protein transport protein sec23-2 [Schizosaccharomyces pombe 972h-]CAA22877.1 COPII cargo receptor subunit Sec23b (predicted) [Schizosaccharomyces pombe]|eukprot:NP_596319.1 putative COPII cargo receptor subunit Sec23b [Schizosaccharomyces pombe]